MTAPTQNSFPKLHSIKFLQFNFSFSSFRLNLTLQLFSRRFPAFLGERIFQRFRLQIFGHGAVNVLGPEISFSVRLCQNIIFGHACHRIATTVLHILHQAYNITSAHHRYIIKVFLDNLLVIYGKRNYMHVWIYINSQFNLKTQMLTIHYNKLRSATHRRPGFIAHVRPSGCDVCCVDLQTQPSINGIHFRISYFRASVNTFWLNR